VLAAFNQRRERGIGGGLQLAMSKGECGGFGIGSGITLSGVT
jgi:hypothetical protein